MNIEEVYHSGTFARKITNGCTLGIKHIPKVDARRIVSKEIHKHI